MKPVRLLVVAAFVSVCHAQEVRRALPANAPSLDNYQNPAWMDRLPDGQAVEVRRAEPASVPAPAGLATPPSVNSSPTPSPGPSSATPDVLDDPQNIRIVPSAGASSRAESALDKANTLYSRKLYDLAIPEYEAFLIADPSSPARDAALFRLAECHRMAGNAQAARAAYEKLLLQFQNGEFAAAGAYRLGEILVSQNLHQPAAMQFDLAAREAKEPGIRVAAAYLAARNWDASNQSQSAEDRYRAVMTVEGDNPYRENAALALAAIQMKQGKKQGALDTFELLASSPSPDIASRSALQAARLAVELGSNTKALQLFDKAASVANDPAMKSDAILAALRLRYDSGDFRGVTEMGEGIEKSLPASAQAEALGILAAAWRRLGNEEQAKRVYDRLVAQNPDGIPSEVRYQRLLSLYATKDPQLVAEVERFLPTSKDPKQTASASLLKAEALFQKPDYAAAAKAYAPLVENSALKPEQRSAALYKLAWALDASGDSAGAVRSYTAFAEKYPGDPLAATSVLQRGLARQKAGSYDEALADFDEVINRFQFSKEVEIAILQKALTLGQQKNYPEMAAAFQELLRRYPNSAASAQAHFWLGWAAFEKKDYQQAIPLLDKARLLDSKNYADRATLRILLAEYQLQDRAAASREADVYKGGAIPADVALWLAQGWLEEKKFSKAEKLLLPLVQNPASVPAQVWIMLSETRLALAKNEEASQAADKAIAATNVPSEQARAFLAKANAEIALRRAASARQAIDQALFLQPEGKLNADARLASGEVFFLEQDYESAARAFMAVSILVDDPQITPKALRRAVDAYRRASKDAEADKALLELSQRFPGSALGASP
ncbi:MAG: tetratricopeptide repeat protein [bacterium]